MDFSQARQDDNWLKDMYEGLDQIKKNQTWELIPRPTKNNFIGM